MSDLQIHVGEGQDAMGARFINAWHRAERGERSVSIICRSTASKP